MGDWSLSAFSDTLDRIAEYRESEAQALLDELRNDTRNKLPKNIPTFSHKHLLYLYAHFSRCCDHHHDKRFRIQYKVARYMIRQAILQRMSSNKESYEHGVRDGLSRAQQERYGQDMGR